LVAFSCAFFEKIEIKVSKHTNKTQKNEEKTEKPNRWAISGSAFRLGNREKGIGWGNQPTSIKL